MYSVLNTVHSGGIANVDLSPPVIPSTPVSSLTLSPSVYSFQRYIPFSDVYMCYVDVYCLVYCLDFTAFKHFNLSYCRIVSCAMYCFRYGVLINFRRLNILIYRTAVLCHVFSEFNYFNLSYCCIVSCDCLTTIYQIISTYYRIV